MRIYSRSTLRAHWELPGREDSQEPLQNWFKQTLKAEWTCFADIRAESSATVSSVGNDRVVFNIHGNRYRLVVKLDYKFRVVLVRFVGTHAEYDQIADISNI